MRRRATGLPPRSMEMQTTVKSSLPIEACRRSIEGSSRMQGGHQVAQKLTSVTLPSKSASVTLLPSASVHVALGRGCVLEVSRKLRISLFTGGFARADRLLARPPIPAETLMATAVERNSRRFIALHLCRMGQINFCFRPYNLVIRLVW